MLDQMTPEEFEERWLADSLDPIDDTWLQTGTLAAVIANKLEDIVVRIGGGRLNKDDLLKPNDFIPQIQKRRKLPTGPTAEELEMRWKARVGSR